MADIGAADSAIPSEEKNTEHKALPHDDNSPSSSGLPESSDQPSSYVIQSASSPSAFSTTDQHPRNGASVFQPAKLGGNFRPGMSTFGGESNIGSFGTNPFAQNAVSHAEPVSEGVIAPSKFASSPMANRFSTGETESDEDKGSRGFRSVLAPSKMGFKNKEEAKNKFQFRPSVLSSKVDSLMNKDCRVASSDSVSVSSILKPATLPDPRIPADSGGSDNEAQAKPVSSPDSKTSSVGDSGGSTSLISSTAPDEASKENHFTGLPESRLPNSTLPNSTSMLGNSDFVFGENLSNRVTGVSSTNVSEEGASGFLFGESLAERVKNGEEEKKEESEGETTASSPDRGNQTLAESAREYQAKQETKPDLKEVEVVTGEEEESNVLQATAKLYLFDAFNQTWIERGQGLCRLNDMTSSESGFLSRLIMRTQGSLRVILNTPIWSGMTVERASPKSVRITATDGDDGVKVFLIMSNPKDSENLLRAIEWRLQRLKVDEDTKVKTSDERGSEKRKAFSSDYEIVGKKSRQVPVGVAESTSGASLLREESDSSVQDPETEASCESHSSSLTIRSESE